MSWVKTHSNGSHGRSTQGQDLGIKCGENTSKAQSERNEIQGLSSRMHGGWSDFMVKSYQEYIDGSRTEAR